MEAPGIPGAHTPSSNREVWSALPVEGYRAILVKDGMSQKCTRPQWCTIYVEMEVHYVLNGMDPLGGDPQSEGQ